MRICWAIWGFSSMLTLTIRTAPLLARTVFSRIGPSCLHGPHHGAQKSTMTGVSNEPSTTSAMKLALLTSFTGVAAVPPIKGSLGITFHLRFYQQHGRAPGRRQALPGRHEGHRSGSRKIDDPRHMPRDSDKAQQIAERDGGGSVVLQRMIIQRVPLQHTGIEHRRDEVPDIIGERKRRHASRAYPEMAVKIFGAPKGKTRCAELRRELFEIGAPLFEHYCKPETALLVLEKEALAMCAGKLAAQRHSFGDREDGRMRIGPVSHPECIEMCEQLLGGRQRQRHDGHDAIRGPRKQLL